MSVQIILSFRKCDKSHIQAFHVFFWASFSSYPVLIWRTWEQLTHHLVSHNSLSFHNQRKKTKLKVVLGETFFWVLGKPKKNLTFLTFYEILERTKGSSSKEKEMLKHAKKKYNEKWWRIDKKPRLLWFPVSGISLSCLLFTKEQYNPAIFIPHLEPIKTQEFGLNHRSFYSRWPPPGKRKKTDSSITVTQWSFQFFNPSFFTIYFQFSTIIKQCDTNQTYLVNVNLKREALFLEQQDLQFSIMSTFYDIFTLVDDHHVYVL